MEEKERYEIDKSTSYYTNTIVDTETNTYYGNIEEHIDLLNQQAKQIKDLEQQLSKDFTLGEYIRIEQENQQLKQQLHDLPKKIIDEIEKSFTEYLPLKDKTGAGFYGQLNAILKKYGGENE